MKRLIVLASMMLMMAGMASAQVMKLGLKASYSTVDINELYSDVSTSIESRSLNLLKQGDVGLMMRFYLGNHFYLQPEANVSMNPIWDSVEANGTILEQAVAAYNVSKSLSINVPVLVGWTTNKRSGFAFRVFAGPEFYTTYSLISEDARNFDYQTFSVLGGIGVDLLKFITIDLRAKWTPDAIPSDINNIMNTPISGPMFYTLSVGIML